MQAGVMRIDDFISDRRTLVIPVYQRNYDWKESNCAKLFDDMTEAIQRNRPHFIGTFVYQHKPAAGVFQEFIIIDGQQRITSTILFARALYEIADDDLKDDIRTTFIKHSKGEMKNKCKLRPTEYDCAVFEKLMSNEVFDENNFDADEKASAMYRNFLFFSKKISESELSPKTLYDSIYQLNVVSILLQEENPQEIFESLNSTGLDLTQADLIRNYLLMPLEPPQQDRLYKNYWLKIEGLLRPSGNVENFIVQYLIATRQSNAVKQEHMSKQKLYEPFKKFFADNFGDDKIEEFLSELLRYAKFFSRCIFSDTTNFVALPALDKKFYELTFLLRAENAPIILMYLLNRHERGDFDEATFIKFVDALISLAFRAKVCGSNGIDQQFAGNVLARLEKNLSDVDSFWQAITFGKGRYSFPNNEVFQTVLESNELREHFSDKECKYFLFALERQTNVVALPDYSETVVEQILPQKPNTAWKNYLEAHNDLQVAENWGKNIGNLTLAGKNDNGSKDLFDNKKVRYVQSKFSCTRAVANYPAWTSKQIQARAKKLSGDALKVWSLPSKYNEILLKQASIFTLDSDFNTLTGKHPATLSVLGKETEKKYWKDLLSEIVSQFYELDKDIFRQATKQENVRPTLFGTTPKDFKLDEDFYMDTGFSAKDCLKFAKILVENFDALNGTNFKDEIWFTLRQE